MADMMHPPFRHSDSNCLTGENTAEVLLYALKNQDLPLFASTISGAEPDDINKFHGFPNDCTLLTAAVERGLTDYVELLLDNGADVNLENQVRKVSAIHLAARNGHADALRLLLRHHADVNCRKAGAGQSGQTPLHVLISSWVKSGPQEEDAESEEVKARKDRWWDCLDVLLSQPQIDLNAEDNNETAPLELAVRKKLRPLAEKLLNAGAAINAHVREAMREKSMEDLLAVYENVIVDEGDGTVNNNAATLNELSIDQQLWKALNQGNMQQLHDLLNLIKSRTVPYNLDSSTAGRPTMLQFCCRRELEMAVELLLEAGCSPNETSANDVTPPLIIAAYSGNFRILSSLAAHPRIQINVIDNSGSNQTALHKVVQRLPVDRNRFLQCLNTLLEPQAHRKKINVNAQDTSRNTPLHYAAQTGVEESVLQLLRHGSHLGVKNIFGETAVRRILPSTLENFFDSCVQCNDQERSSRDFAITFHYSLLAPPNRPAPGEELVALTDSRNDEIEIVETDQTEDDTVQPESEALWHMSRSSRHKYLLKHPLVTSFLMLKWKNISKYYYLNVGVYLVAVAVLSSYILLLNSSYPADNNSVQNFLSVLWYLLVFFISVLCLREFFQLGIAPLRYIFSLENYIEIAMLTCTAVVLNHWQDPVPWRSYSAWAVLLAWAELLLLFGRHPRMSTFITMFATVLKTFMQLLLWYSVLLIGFAFSFFLVFQPTGSQEEGNKQSEDNKESAFENIPLSLLKVASMMTGEFEYGDLPFDVNPVASRLIFLAFLFLITIVLLNLLNGMAVSDTQAIQNKAEIIGYVSRVELISYMESMLLGDPFDFLADWPPFSWIRCLPAFVSPIANLLRFKWIRKFIQAEGTALFYRCLPRKTFTVYPNRKTAYASNDPHTFSPDMCHCHSKFRLPDDIVQDAYQRIQERSRYDPSVSLLSEMEKLRATLGHMQRQQAELLQLFQKKTLVQ